MNRTSNRRFFDLSSILALGIASLLLISMPGGCGDSENDVENGDTDAIAEPTPIPTMEIVDPEPGDVTTASQNDDETEEPNGAGGDNDEGNGEEEGEEAAGESEPSDDTYTVQSGDTLYAIAVQFDVSVEALLEANGMDDANTLQVGQVLVIPR